MRWHTTKHTIPIVSKNTQAYGATKIQMELENCMLILGCVLPPYSPSKSEEGSVFIRHDHEVYVCVCKHGQTFIMQKPDIHLSNTKKIQLKQTAPLLHGQHVNVM